MINNKIIVSDNEIRLDKYLTNHFKKENLLISRTKIQQLINSEQIIVNNKIVNSNYFLKIGDKINVKNILINKNNFKIVAKDIFFEIIYEDNDLMVINKSNNLVVHPSPGHYEDTLVNGLLNKQKTWSTIGGKERPGIIHRIDRQTTGLLVIAKNNEAHRQLQLQIQNKTLHRKYLAIVHGNINEEKGKISAPIGRDPNNRKKMAVTNKNSKSAVTNFIVIKRFKDYTYIECELETGRTHQIRVHLKFINHPILGDPVYGYKTNQNEKFGQYLHAYQISFTHFRTGENMLFEIPLLIEMKNKLIDLERKEDNNYE